MTTNSLSSSWSRSSDAYFSWRSDLTLVKKILMALGMAALTGLAAQIRIPLPFTPVPVTGQTFAVLLAGVVLGRGWGGLSQIFYVAFGAMGLPWFAGQSGGFGVLVGPTGGYLVGFIAAASLIGFVVDRYPAVRKFPRLFVLMLTSSLLLIHGFGLLQLAAYFSLVKGSLPSLQNLLWMGSIPFLPGEILKDLLAASFATALWPKK